MLPTYKIAEKSELVNGHFVILETFILDDLGTAKMTLEELSRGQNVNNYRIVQGIWMNGKVAGWVFVE